MRVLLTLALAAFITTAHADFYVGGRIGGHNEPQRPAYPADAYKRPNQEQPFRTMPRDAYGPAPEQTVNIREWNRHDPKNPVRKHQLRGSEIRISR